MFIIAANWKMNGDRKFAEDYSNKLKDLQTKHELIIFPPFTLISKIRGNFKRGGQNCNSAESGAFTGEVSAKMLKESTCEYVLLGHSERREAGETSELVSKKANSAHQAGLKTIVCIGEKDSEDFSAIVKSQLAQSLPDTATVENTVIAYEPVWAIGTGKTPTLDEIEERHQFIQSESELKVIYGGSVKLENAAEISKLKSVSGLLIGGASLDVDILKQIISAVKL